MQLWGVMLHHIPMCSCTWSAKHGYYNARLLLQWSFISVGVNHEADLRRLVESCMCTVRDARW